MNKLRLEEAVVVEGKYDVVKLALRQTRERPDTRTSM